MQSENEDQKLASQWIQHWTDVFASNPDAAESAEAFFCPPEPSGDEQPAPQDADFLESCRADVVAMSKGPVVWEDELLTHSPKWGLVWRADFWDPKRTDQGYPSRVTCWKDADGEFGMTISGCQHDKLGLKR